MNLLKLLLLAEKEANKGKAVEQDEVFSKIEQKFSTLKITRRPYTENIHSKGIN